MEIILKLAIFTAIVSLVLMIWDINRNSRAKRVMMTVSALTSLCFVMIYAAEPYITGRL